MTNKPIKADKKNISRRSILRGLSITGLASVAGFLFKRAYDSGDCIGNSKCRQCLSKQECTLPLLSEFKKEQEKLKTKQRQKRKELVISTGTMNMRTI